MDEIPSEPSLLQAEQSQLSQAFLIGEAFQFLNYLHGPSLDSLQHVHVSLVLQQTEMDITAGVASPVLSRGVPEKLSVCSPCTVTQVMVGPWRAEHHRDGREVGAIM